MRVEHNKMELNFVQTEKGLRMTAVQPCDSNSANSVNSAKTQKPIMPCTATSFAFLNKPFGFHSALSQGYSNLALECDEVSSEFNEHGGVIVYKHPWLHIELTVKMEFVENCTMVRQTTTIKNIGDQTQTINHLASAFVGGIAMDGLLEWFDTRKLRVHYCIQSWNGEGQWRSSDPEGLGLYKTSNHPNVSGINFSSIGTWSTGQFYPVIMLEDLETGKIWYFQMESSSNWHIEIGHRSDWDETDGGFFVQCDAADERYGGWSLNLKPGETFTTEPVAYGCCKGSFETAVRELTKYRRKCLKTEVPFDEGFCPVTFNDYLNCLWGNPSSAALKPLIDAVSKVGAECFCIDAGWYNDIEGGWGSGLGDWNPSRDRFDGGLAEILSYIRGKGMIPGLWLEIEVCSENAELGSKPDSWFLMRNGLRVGGGERWFLNFANPEVCAYMHAKIDALVELGAGYFKNDYNASVGNGVTENGYYDENAAQGLLEHTRAFNAFIDEVRERHPKLIIENCGSGAMRSDYSTLSHFHLQSFSDQEDYMRNPSVFGGSIANILPEQLGVWSVAYPLLSGHPNEELYTEAYRKTLADGENTVFNMVCGLCANMYLSGHLEAADELNAQLVAEGVALYKKERNHISNGYPVWPIGFTRINNRNTWAAVGIENEEKTRLTLGVWRLETGEDTCILPLKLADNQSVSVNQIFPCDESMQSEYSFNPQNGCLTVKLPKQNCARLYEIKVK